MESIGTRFLSAFLFLVDVSPSAAREPAEEFVKGLQARGLHELALEYLEQLKTSPLANEASRRQIPYLRGVALHGAVAAEYRAGGAKNQIVG